jgi:hypothetical protein
LAARNLLHVRQLVGTDLVDQVDRITQEMNAATDEIAWVDRDLLRGIPAIGGVITDSHVPGSDEHLDNIRRTA